jgi:hypothetical protein
MSEEFREWESSITRECPGQSRNRGYDANTRSQPDDNDETHHRCCSRNRVGSLVEYLDDRIVEVGVQDVLNVSNAKQEYQDKYE